MSAKVSAWVPISIRFGRGARVSICSTTCALRWCEYFEDEYPTPIVDYQQRRVVRQCTHCGWCGYIVAAPEHKVCNLHRRTVHCPQLDWHSVGVAPMVVGIVMRMAGTTELTDRMQMSLDVVAEDLSGDTGWPDANMWAQEVFRQRDLW